MIKKPRWKRRNPCISNGAFLFFGEREFYRTLKYDIIIFKNQEQFIVIYVE